MKVFLAISGGLATSSVNQIEYPNILNSYAYKVQQDAITYKPKNLILDSGAFTAWSSGKKIDIEAYGQHCLAWQSKADSVRCVNLDVIPGSKGQTSTAKQREQGMRDSVENADYLRSLGLDIEEVFHQDEPFDFLDKLLDRLPSNGVLGLGSRKDVSLNLRVIWLQSVLKHMVDRFGKNNLPMTHGLGVTNRDMMLAFPFYSVDSSTFMNPTRFGTTIDHTGRHIRVEELLGQKVAGSSKSDKVNRQMIIMSIEHYKKLEALATTTWKRRGIVWED